MSNHEKIVPRSSFLVPRSSFLVLVFAVSALATSPKVDPGPAVELSISDAEIYRRQQPLLEVADELAAFLRTQRPSPWTRTNEPAGFTSIELDVAAKKVVLYWKRGIRMPPVVTSKVGQMLNRPNVTLTIEDADFSKDELLAEIEAIFVEAKNHPNIVFAEVGPRPKGAGLYVEIETPQSAFSGMENHALFSNARARLNRKAQKLAVSESVKVMRGDRKRTASSRVMKNAAS